MCYCCPHVLIIWELFLPLIAQNYLAFSWLAKANLAAFSCSLANLFSYLETFFRVGLMNLPFMSLTEMVSSLIWRSLRMTSLWRKNISASSLYHLSKFLADLLEIINTSVVNVSLGSASLSDDSQSLLGLALLLLLQLLGSLLPEQSPQLLLALGGHESLLLGHDESLMLL